ncbi:MAG: iron ABC transporter permease [Desulfobulbaceae bacterium]|nr:iron ABC transporter permease [Desulfobulbaceae bacterium]
MIVQQQKTKGWLLLAAPLLFLSLFYFYPLLKIFSLSFFPDGSWTNSGLVRFFSTPTYLRILWFTCWQAALSTLLTLIVALPGAYIYAHYSFPGKGLVRVLTTIPFVLPTVVTATAFRALLGDGGLVNTLLMNLFHLQGPPIHLNQSIAFFLLAHVFYNYALVMRIVGGYWAGLAPELQQAASMLGASPCRVFTKITLPLLMPAIGSAALLIFIFCFTSFGVVLILGGPKFATLEVEIYRQAIHLFNLPMAATLSLIQILMNFFLMWLHARLSQRADLSWFEGGGSEKLKPARTRWDVFWITANMGFMGILLLAPLLALVIRSFLGDHGWTPAYYLALFTQQTDSLFFVPPASAIFNSIGFALATMGLALLLGLSAAAFIALPKKTGAALWDALIMLPLATSAVTLGFGYIITLNKPPLNLRNSGLLVIFAHTLVAFPFVIRCLLPSLRRIPTALREAAALLGASPLQIKLSIDLPLISKALMGGAVFAFAISMGEFGASTFVTRPQTPTLPVAIFRFLSRPGELNYGQAMAMSVILMLVTSLAFFLLEKLQTAGRR